MTILDVHIHYNNQLPQDSFFLKLLPTLVGGLISLVIAFFVFFINQWVAKRKEKQRIKEVREYYYTSLLNYKVGINEQIEIFEKDIFRLQVDIKNNISIFRKSIFTHKAYPNELMSISKNDTFKFFIQNNTDNQQYRIRKYTNHYILLNAIASLLQLNLEEHKKYFLKFDDSQKNITKLSDKLLGMLNKRSHELRLIGKNLKIGDPFYSKMLSLYNDYIPKKNGTFDPFVELFIKPLNKFSKENFRHTDSTEISYLCQNIEDIHLKLLENKKIEIENKSKWLKQFNHAKNNILELIEMEFQDMGYGEEIFKKEFETITPLKKNIFTKLKSLVKRK